MQASIVREVTSPVFCDRDSRERRIGLILLATDLTSERDFARMLPAGETALYCSRIAFVNPTTPENLRRMQPELSDAAALLLPGEQLDAICYCCTAASVVIGDHAVEDAIASGKPDTPVITPATAARAGLGALGVRRLSILTPYSKETSLPVADYFSRHGFDVRGVSCMGLADDRDMARVSRDSIITAARDAITADADALFISCTAMRAAELAGEIEAVIGKPVVTSNQASVWMSLRLCGIGRAVGGYGELLRLPLPAGDRRTDAPEAASG